MTDADKVLLSRLLLTIQEYRDGQGPRTTTLGDFMRNREKAEANNARIEAKLDGLVNEVRGRIDGGA